MKRFIKLKLFFIIFSNIFILNVNALTINNDVVILYSGLKLSYKDYDLVRKFYGLTDDRLDLIYDKNILEMYIKNAKNKVYFNDNFIKINFKDNKKEFEEIKKEYGYYLLENNIVLENDYLICEPKILLEPEKKDNIKKDNYLYSKNGPNYDLYCNKEKLLMQKEQVEDKSVRRVYIIKYIIIFLGIIMLGLAIKYYLKKQHFFK